MATWRQFERQALELIVRIPPGRVSSYGRIAACIPPPPGMDPNGYRRIAARKVGTALRNLGRRGAGTELPELPPVPWHRVLNYRGCSSLEGQAADLQRALLEDEGVPFDDSGCVDLARFAWDFSEGGGTGGQVPAP
ncbi:MAG: MGMT family protein [Anaerolineaceae bacterium]|nr:MGMT family protein [Anaerolineaceae bacterium]